MSDEKVALVTGANSGIGKEIVRGLSRSGLHVIMLCRNAAKANAARDDLLQELPNASLSIELADLSDLRQVHSAAMTIKERFSHLDVLINNAGLYLNHRKESVDGYEMTFAVNHLAAFALTEYLLPLLQRRAKQVGEGRIVTVASRAHYYGRLNMDDLNSTQSYNGMRVYGRSKMANIRHTRHLAKRLVGSDVSANCLHPGVISTGFASGQGGLTGWGFKLFSWAMRGPAEGADTALHLALSPEMSGKTGGYYYQRRLGRLSRQAADVSVDEILHERSIAMLKASLGPLAPSS